MFLSIGTYGLSTNAYSRNLLCLLMDTLTANNTGSICHIKYIIMFLTTILRSTIIL